ncbi:hypothetical protein ACWDKQ_36320, partial [Saccharopolyspora sp. NPDC000995]
MGELMGRQAELAALAALQELDADLRAERAELAGRIEEVQAELATMANDETDRKARKAAAAREDRAREKEERAELAADGRARLEALVARQAGLGEELRQAVAREAQWAQWPGVVSGLHEWDEARPAVELAALRGHIADLRAEWVALPGRIEAVRAELAAMVNAEADRKARNAAGQRKWQAREKEKRARADARLGELVARRARLAALPELDAGLRAEWEALPGRIEAVRAELETMANEEVEKKAKQAAADRERWARKKKERAQADARLGELVARQAWFAALPVLDAGLRAEFPGPIEAVRAELATMADDAVEGPVVEGQVSSGGEGSSFAGGSPAVVSVPGDAPG